VTLELREIPPDCYADYRYDVIFNAYKWDPQVGDTNTIARHALIITKETADTLRRLSERLAAELDAMEAALLKRPDLLKQLGFDGRLRKTLATIKNNNHTAHPRLMRFDFHPTADGWRISEVNSDVPGGLAEASALPQLARRFFADAEPGEDVVQHIMQSFTHKISGDRVAFVHATSYADDRQVMQCLSDRFKHDGYETLFAAPDHMRFDNGRPRSVLADAEGPVDGIIRFFPLEWLANLSRRTGWDGYFHCAAPCMNHPAAMLTQSKRLPLVWDALGVDVPCWKELLPHTVEPGAATDGYIYKPAFGRVGAGVSVPGVVNDAELVKIKRSARKYNRAWAAQRLFDSAPVMSPDGAAHHVCIGVFTVDGACAGFYGRASDRARIDEYARDIPVLLRRE